MSAQVVFFIMIIFLGLQDSYTFPYNSYTFLASDFDSSDCRLDFVSFHGVPVGCKWLFSFYRAIPLPHAYWNCVHA